ncbi:expressed unknown protein [Seminavis robusta]|uniref:Uncharacterized protein n=1 Tax=Seminavis robusta TaxID=568900 RepID=A0A9N8HS26_9STRA|nr:expressed unknown protein [Seminavis robusta]|eukprot:Sro1386_g268330.1 n/a (374) ;mRNA; r:28605-29726
MKVTVAVGILINLVSPARGSFLRLLQKAAEDNCEYDLVNCQDTLAICLGDDDVMESAGGMDDDNIALEGSPSFTFVRPPPPGDNTCEGTDPDFESIACMIDGVVNALEQAGANVTEGYVGEIETEAVPITSTFFEAGLCPVNVHWHRGTEHYSLGQYDENGSGPTRELDEGFHGSYPEDEARLGYECSLYDETDPKFTTPYDWQYCTSMTVGETYEIHWPHSSAGACGTLNQYQTPFQDGVFCKSDEIELDPLSLTVGVQAQVFVIVNDETYFYPQMMRGMLVDGEMGKYVTKYTGSTTGTSFNDEICSAYTPITWQVDRMCHLISASSIDKLCADMLSERNDMSGDTQPHGSRELVPDDLAANNHQNRAFRY